VNPVNSGLTLLLEDGFDFFFSKVNSNPFLRFTFSDCPACEVHLGQIGSRDPEAVSPGFAMQSAQPTSADSAQLPSEQCIPKRSHRDFVPFSLS